MQTELGRIAHLLSTAEESVTPLQRRLARVSQTLLYICGGIVAIVALAGLLRGWPLLQVFMAAVSLAVARSEIDQRLLRFTFIPALVTTLAMALTVTGLVMWGLGLRAAVPDLWNGNDGLAATNTALSWANVAALMVIATLIAAVALVRGRGSQGAAQPA